jgi:hypothetical protein
LTGHGVLGESMGDPDLAFLDIDPEDERFYRVLLRSGGADPEQLVRHAGLDEEAVRVLRQRATALVSPRRPTGCCARSVPPRRYST